LKKFSRFRLHFRENFFKKIKKPRKKFSEVPKFFSDFVSKIFPHSENFFEKIAQKFFLRRGFLPT